ncbi:hypothetical protein PSACC_02668 [Paramicrosporidium saccamoebae]|uniref:DnaJ homolog 1, mitochondrial n=1 Tax=Paramicrosporidium saccamoebae TaxID=1246581 RepID=A0A2H9TIL4_9FUNG|nr:hypothetical protein PSACC_02668 [Paramicrosporidium saccamoebae]
MGRVNPNPCSPCGGSGVVQKDSTITVDIPAGVADGEAWSVRKEGNRMLGQTGNLIVKVRVDKDSPFLRKKNDIYVTVPISMYEALVGGTIIVPTISGNVEMKIPPGTQPDDVKRMSGRGVYKASTGEQGHQFVKLKVEVPRTITAEQRELLEKCFGSGSGPRDAESKKHEESDTKTATNQWFDKLRRWLKWY